MLFLGGGCSGADKNNNTNNNKNNNDKNNNDNKTTTTTTTARKITTTPPAATHRKKQPQKQEQNKQRPLEKTNNWARQKETQKRTNNEPNCLQIAQGSNIGPKIAHTPQALLDYKNRHSRR